MLVLSRQESSVGVAGIYESVDTQERARGLSNSTTYLYMCSKAWRGEALTCACSAAFSPVSTCSAPACAAAALPAACSAAAACALAAATCRGNKHARDVFRPCQHQKACKAWLCCVAAQSEHIQRLCMCYRSSVYAACSPAAATCQGNQPSSHCNALLCVAEM